MYEFPSNIIIIILAPGRRNLLSNYWSEESETLKTIQAIAAAMDCLPEVEGKSRLRKTTCPSDTGFGRFELDLT